MDNMKALWNLPNKGQFIIDHLSQPSFFLELSSISLKKRQQLARELIETRFSYNFYDLIDSLTYANTSSKKNEYLRAGHQDFLGFLVQALIQHIDGQQITTIKSFNDYKPSKEVVEVITKMKFTISCRDTLEGKSLMDNFAPNIMVGVFYPLWLEKELDEIKLFQKGIYFENHKKQKTEQNTWIYSRFTDCEPSTSNATQKLQLFEKYQADAMALKTFVAQQPWTTPKVPLFSTAVKVDINEHTYYLPHSVATMVNSLQANINKDPDLIVTWLSLEQEAALKLETPEKLSPTLQNLYQFILDRKHLPELSKRVEPHTVRFEDNWVI